MAQKTEKLSFWNGYNQIARRDLFKFKEEIMQAVGCKTRTSFYQKLHGQENLRVWEKEAIDAVFKKYGITKNIWGNDDDENKIIKT